MSGGGFFFIGSHSCEHIIRSGNTWCNQLSTGNVKLVLWLWSDVAACVLKHQIHRYVSICHASLHTSPCASFLRSATRLHLFSNKPIPRGRSTPLLPWRCLSAPALQRWIWDSALTDAAMVRVFLKHPPRSTPSCDDHMVAWGDSGQTRISNFVWELGFVKKKLGSECFSVSKDTWKAWTHQRIVMHSGLPSRCQTLHRLTSVPAADWFQLLSSYLCARVLRRFGPNKAEKPRTDIMATSKITLMTRGLEEEKSREMGLVQPLGLVLSVWGTERWK